MTVVVPTCLTAACPELRTLQLSFCNLQGCDDEDVQGDAAAGFPTQLQTLCWRQSYNSSGILPQRLISALAALPNLTSLELGLVGTGSSDDMCTVLSALAGQLTRLVWRPSRHSEPCLASFLSVPATWMKLTQLQCLDVSPSRWSGDWNGIIVNDAALRVLLAHMKTLTHVHVHTVELQHSHADVGCSWEELSMDNVSVTSLAHLPLRGIKRVWVKELESALTTAGDGGGAGVAAAASHTAAAAKLSAALATAPDCAFDCSSLTLKCHVHEMPVLLPLLARWKEMEALVLKTPSGECMTTAAMGALRALLESMPDCDCLTIIGPTPHPSALLLPALANTNVTAVDLRHDHMTDAELMLWCEGGQPSHPVKVILDLELEFVGNMHRVLEAVSVPDSGVHLVDDGAIRR